MQTIKTTLPKRCEWGRIKNSESLHFKELSSAAGGDNLPGVTNGDKRNKERNEEKKTPQTPDGEAETRARYQWGGCEFTLGWKRRRERKKDIDKKKKKKEKKKKKKGENEKKEEEVEKKK